MSGTPATCKSLTNLSVAGVDALWREWTMPVRLRAPGLHCAGRSPPEAAGSGRGTEVGARCSHVALGGAGLAQALLDLGGSGLPLRPHESATQRCNKDVLARLESMAVFPLERRQRRTPGKSLSKLIEDCPVVEVIIDSHE